jgi:endonuclease I
MNSNPAPFLRGALGFLLISALLAASAPATDDHLLLCEAALSPTAGEFIEITNATPSTVSLADYYLSDDDDYSLLPGASGAGPAPVISASDFIARFPAGASIPPCGVVVVSLDGAGFLATYGVAADYEIRATHAGTPDMIQTDVGVSAGLTDSGESAVLFTWNGVADLVQDIDMVNLGQPSDANDVASKTGVSVDGPDPGTIASTYLADSATMPDQSASPGSGVSTKRATPEESMEATPGGNGLTGDDETSEDILVTWDSLYTFTAPNPGSCAFTAECYYDAVVPQDPTTVRAVLHQLIDDHEPFPYTSPATDTWDILDLADEDPGNSNNILDVYKNASYPKAGGANANYQREHTWPNSFGFPDDSDVAHTDCHALFLADGDYNLNRSNHPYRHCTDPGCVQYPTDPNNGQGGPGHSNWELGDLNTGTWETWDGRRGDVARAQFYMHVRYDGGTHVSGEPEPDLILTDDASLIVTTGSNPPVGYMGILTDLLQWHLEDPVDSVEQARNEIVFLYQRNRNPFIDHPEWVRLAMAGLRPIFADGFESGDTSAWSATAP